MRSANRFQVSFFFKFHIARIEWLEVICGYELQIFGNPEKLCLNDYFGHFIFLSNENFDKSLSASAIDKMQRPLLKLVIIT